MPRFHKHQNVRVIYYGDPKLTLYGKLVDVVKQVSGDRKAAMIKAVREVNRMGSAAVGLVGVWFGQKIQVDVIP